jgi:hypothetical protein
MFVLYFSVAVMITAIVFPIVEIRRYIKYKKYKKGERA